MRLLRYVLDRLPYIGKLRRMVRDTGAFPPGHFYSPIPDRSELEKRINRRWPKDSEDPLCPEIDYRHGEQFETLKQFAAFYPELPFSEQKTSECRYYYNQSAFTYTDAIFLYSFLRQFNPKRIIEVGSGFSSAVILDTVEQFGSEAQLTFIEPYPDKLYALLRANDRKRVRIFDEKVQHVRKDVFAGLESGDLLFIDSSHVLKCGSDLQFLMFDILPFLPKGVFVHFHDVFQSFEYPDVWIRDGWYWNEDYVLRAFLAHNSAWEICFFNNYVRYRFEAFLQENMPLCLKDIGGSLYLRRVG